MQQDDQRQKSNWPMRIILFLAVLMIVWTGLWFVAAEYTKKQVARVQDTMARSNIAFDCGQLSTGGYPFGLALTCDTMTLDDKVHAYAAAAGQLQGGVYLTAPTTIRSTIQSPANFDAAGQSITASWNGLSLDVDASKIGFDLATLSIDDFQAESDVIDFDARSGVLRLRPVEFGKKKRKISLQIASDVRELTIRNFRGESIPPFDLSVQATLQKAYRHFFMKRRSLDAWLRDGSVADISSLRLNVPEGGSLVLSGKLKVKKDGRLDGDLLAGLSGTEALVRWAAQTAPDLAPALSNMGQAVAVIGQPASLGGEEFRAIPLKIKDSTVSVGFIKLGRIPPLF